MAKMLTVRMDDGEHAALAAMAKARGKSVAALVKGLLDDTATPQQQAQPDVAVGLNPHPISPEAKYAPGAAGKSWKSAEAYVAAQPVVTPRDVHAQCLAAERASWAREEQARADYKVMLGILQSIAVAKEQSPGSGRYIVFGDLMARILAVIDEVHERESQAAEFAVDLDMPF